MTVSLIRVILYTALFVFLATGSAHAQEAASSGRDKRQPPVQVIVQITVTTIVLKMIDRRITP